MKNPLPAYEYLRRTREKDNDIRGPYFRDQTAIIHSLAFRRLKHKTQVFFAPKNDHICTRIEHVMHVATIAKTICKGLNAYGWNLDIEMAFAIGLAHDLGHTPFGHIGEHILNKRLGGNNAFVHEVNGYRVVEHLANNGKGLNLAYGVKDGIITHNGEQFEQSLKPDKKIKNLNTIKKRGASPNSYEACIVRFSDKIAYLGRDIEDALVAGFITRNQIPEKVKMNIGETNSEIIDKFVYNVVETSKNNDSIGLSDLQYELLLLLRDFNYKYIYLNEKRKLYEPFAGKILNNIFDHLNEICEKNKNDYDKYATSHIKLDRDFGHYLDKMQETYKNEPYTIAITDYIAGMTDIYAMDSMKQISFPSPIFTK